MVISFLTKVENILDTKQKKTAGKILFLPAEFFRFDDFF